MYCQGVREYKRRTENPSCHLLAPNSPAHRQASKVHFGEMIPLFTVHQISTLKNRTHGGKFHQGLEIGVQWNDLISAEVGLDMRPTSVVRATLPQRDNIHLNPRVAYFAQIWDDYDCAVHSALFLSRSRSIRQYGFTHSVRKYATNMDPQRV